MTEQNLTPDLDDAEGHVYTKDDEGDTEGHVYTKDDDEDDTAGHGYKK